MDKVKRLTEAFLNDQSKLKTFIDFLIEKLNQDGYVVVPVAVGVEKFYEIAAALGPILQKDDINIDPNKKNYVHSPKEIPLHTDSNVAKYLGWIACCESTVDEPTILVDTNDKAFRRLSENNLAQLKRIKIEGSTLNSVGEVEINSDGMPLISESPMLSDQGYFYVPFLNRDILSPEETDALDCFEDCVYDAEMIEIGLLGGQFFFIDNSRMLHGRGELNPKTNRLLKRVWIGRTVN